MDKCNCNGTHGNHYRGCPMNMANRQGGKREGAGRKPAPVGTTKQVYNTKLTPQVVQFLRQCSNAAETIDDTLRRSKAFREFQGKRKTQ